MSKIKIVSFLPITAEVLSSRIAERIDPATVEIVAVPKKPTEEEACQAVEDATVILTWPRGPYFTRKILEAARGVKLIQFMSVGYDQIDLQASSELKIPVANNPGWNAVAVAEHTIMSIMVLLKKAFYAHQGTTRGEWLQQELVIDNKHVLELRGKTLGILGLGTIGREVAKRARAFQIRMLYNKRTRLSEEEERELDVEYCSFDRLLEESDILTVHVPLNDETRGLIGSEVIDKMKDGAILINTARSAIIDEAALAGALKKGKLSGAGIDVPRDHDKVSAFKNLFSNVKNVILTPHISGLTKEAWEQSQVQTLDNVGRLLEGKKPFHLVNDVWDAG